MENIAVPAPSKAKKNIKDRRFGAKKHPNAEMLTNNTPVKSSDLCLNRIAKKPINKARIARALLLAVKSKVAIPVGTLNVLAKSTANKLIVGVEI